MKVKISAILLLLLVVAGCATARPDARADLLNFICNGQTTKTEVLIKLGQPSATFESENIFTYRLGFDAHNNGYYVMERGLYARVYPDYTTWEAIKYSLVLVFDGHNVLREHSLVEVTQ
jgi:hypothetical protein